MARRLHITNGDASGKMLAEIFGPEDEILCWRDVLHDGPLTLAPLETHRRRRARFIADTLAVGADRAAYDQILADFTSRDQMLADLAAFDAVTLWFEHDLYDQLQIAEILHRLAAAAALPGELTLVCIDHHPEVPFFHGLGNLTPPQLEALYPHRRPLTTRQLAAGQRIWRALCAPHPLALHACLGQPFEGLPFMAAALRRFCAEFPARSDGLTRTQQQLLQAIGEPLADLPLLRHHLELQANGGRLARGQSAASRYQEIMNGPLRFGRLFLSLQTLEDAPFMGDLAVLRELDLLCTAATPYVRAEPDPNGNRPAYALTDAGRAALAGDLHWAAVNAYDLWRGGVHLRQPHLWYWEELPGRFIQD